MIDAQAARLRETTQNLLAGTILLADWQLQMMAAVKATHLVALAVAHGGWNQLDQSDFGWAGQRIREQYRFLADFASDVASGTQPLNGTFGVRITMYASAARATHREAQRRIAAQRGMLAEKNVLGEADHCGGRDSCLRETARGWVPIGTLIPVGSRRCRVNCHCHLIYRSEPAA